MPPAGSGGGGGGDTVNPDDYISFLDYNNNVVYPELEQGYIIWNNGIREEKSNILNTGRIFNNKPTDYTLRIGKNVYGCTQLLNKQAFNGPIIIENGCVSIHSLCCNSKYFNHPINIPPSVNNCTLTFGYTNQFNSRVIFPPNTVSTYSKADRMFENSSIFNQPIIFPKGCANLYDTFSYADNFNQPVVIQTTNVNLYYTFMCNAGASSFASNIIFTADTSNYNNRYISLGQPFYNKNAQKKINIYASNLIPFTASNVKWVTSTALTWTAITNGYYNAAQNIYLYNNVNDALNWFNNYWHDKYGEYPVYAEQ